MVGQGVLRECLLDPEVEHVLAVVRRPTGQQNEKLRELVPPDLFDLSAFESELTGFDACLFCLGVSSVGMTEADYRRITYDLTLSIAHALLQFNPGLTFIYVSGAGTDSSAAGKTMWARVKGETENLLLQLPFRKAYMFRPGLIQPLHGAVSKTGLYRAVYVALTPLFPIARRLAPDKVTTTEQIGRAMLEVAKRGAPKSLLESADIVEAAKRGQRHAAQPA
jgi:uncharacterized protein YbjT (DUF2867 family)